MENFSENKSFMRAGALGLVNIKSVALALLLLFAISYLPFFIHNQWFVGPMVNALLVIILFVSGLRTAVLASLAPSLMALLGGLLPAALTPVIPFIMIANIIFILTIDTLARGQVNSRKYWAGILLGASLKFVFLYFSTSLIIGLLLNNNLAPVVSRMMSWPQLVTALLGGGVAYLVLTRVKSLNS